MHQAPDTSLPRRIGLFLTASTAAAFATASHAQGVQPAWGAYTGGVHLGVGQFAPVQLDAGGNLLVGDANSAAFQGAVPITPGIPTAALRSIGFIVATQGNVTLTLADGSTLTIPLQTAGGAFQTLPFAVTDVSLGAGTVASFWNLK